MKAIDGLLNEVSRLRAGQDDVPPVEGCYPTAGQLWYRLLEADMEQRLLILNGLLDDSYRASRCFQMNCENRYVDSGTVNF